MGGTVRIVGMNSHQMMKKVISPSVAGTAEYSNPVPTTRRGPSVSIRRCERVRSYGIKTAVLDQSNGSLFFLVYTGKCLKSFEMSTSGGSSRRTKSACLGEWCIYLYGSGMHTVRRAGHGVHHERLSRRVNVATLAIASSLAPRCVLNGLANEDDDESLDSVDLVQNFEFSVYQEETPDDTWKRILGNTHAALKRAGHLGETEPRCCRNVSMGVITT